MERGSAVDLDKTNRRALTIFRTHRGWKDQPFAQDQAAKGGDEVVRLKKLLKQKDDTRLL